MRVVGQQLDQLLRLSVWICICVAILTSRGALAQPDDAKRPQPAVIPRPERMTVRPHWFALTEVTVSAADEARIRPIAEYLTKSLEAVSGSQYPVSTRSAATTQPGDPASQPAGPCLQLLLVDAAELGEEGYELKIPNDRVGTLTARTPAGLFHGVQTIRQLLQAIPDERAAEADRRNAQNKSPALPPDEPRMRWVLPGVHIVDRPRYAHRGMLLDCGRHFMTKDFVKRYIDLLAYHKLNVLHWHLTEDQGWRIQIRKYPKLTEVGAWRKVTRDDERPRDAAGRYGGFYTQDDIREIVAYAASRYVTIIPEIEMPGHCLAALASYPELSCTGGPFEVCTKWGDFDDVYCAGSDHTFEFLQDVLSEVIELFPGPYIHIGGDECHKVRWKLCPRCQARIKAEGLKDEHELQGYFIRRIEKFLASKDRKLIGWDEILDGGLPPGATVQSWRGLAGAVAAAKSGHDVISSPTSHCYLDFPQSAAPDAPAWMTVTTLEKVFGFEPTPETLPGKQAHHILGAEGNLWSERAPQSRVDWQVFPRLCALAEVTWSPAKDRDFADFQRRMSVHYTRLDGLEVEYYIPPPDFAAADTVFTDSLDVILVPRFDNGEVRYTLDGTEPSTAAPLYTGPLHLSATTLVRARTFTRSGRVSDAAEQRYRKLRPLAATTVDDTTPGLAYEYFEGRWERLPAFETLRPTASGDVAAPDLSVAKGRAEYALRFSGLIDAPTDGLYTFHLTSDDGSRLWLDGELLIDHDGPHTSAEKSGKVLLDAGRHRIAVEYVQIGGAERLELAWEGPGLNLQSISPQALSRPVKK